MAGFICNDDYLLKTARLSDEELGKLFRACMTYHATGELIELDEKTGMAFDFIREDIDRTEKAYQEKCEKNRQNRLSKLTNDNDRQRSSTNDNDGQRSGVNKIKTNKKKDKDKEIEYMFERFWNVYPRHDSKATARKAFEKLNPTEELMQKIISAIEKQEKSSQWQENGGQFIPYAATWLNQKRWEDEVKQFSGKTVNAQQYSQRDYSGEQDEAMRRMLGNAV